MTSHETPTTFLARLAPTSAARWRAIGAQTFPGELTFATTNSVYRFLNGVFVSRLKKPARSFDVPKGMRGVRLIGFLCESAFSLTWSSGSSAVLWNGELGEDAFIFTSATVELTLEEPEPKPVDPDPMPSPWSALPERAARACSGSGSGSGILVRRSARPPTLRRPLPPSTTRLHNAPPFEIPR
jgi:hypothetical protein